jgi:non-heme chloroperoxidase
MTVRSIEIGGAEVTFRDEGTGTPVIFLHGALGDHRTWRRQVDALRANYRTIALSQRYFPPNKWADDGSAFGVRTHAGDLAALIRMLDLPPAHVVGHSYGGAVATVAAIEHPALIRSLVLAEPALMPLAADVPGARPLITEFGRARTTAFEQWQAGDHARAVEEFVLYVFGRESLERVRSEHYAIMAESGPVIAAAFRGIAPVPLTLDRVQTLTQPTLLIEGANTKPIYHMVCDLLAHRLARVERAMLAGASHALPMEVPDAFNDAVLRFLADK